MECFYQGRSVAEAAARLGVPPGTVKSRTHYALRSLRLVLAEMGVTDDPVRVRVRRRRVRAGRAAPAERAAYERHLAGCAACREAVAEIAVLPGSARPARPGRPGAVPRRPPESRRCPPCSTPPRGAPAAASGRRSPAAGTAAASLCSPASALALLAGIRHGRAAARGEPARRPASGSCGWWPCSRSPAQCRCTPRSG